MKHEKPKWENINHICHPNADITTYAKQVDNGNNNDKLDERPSGAVSAVKQTSNQIKSHSAADTKLMHDFKRRKNYGSLSPSENDVGYELAELKMLPI